MQAWVERRSRPNCLAKWALFKYNMRLFTEKNWLFILPMQLKLLKNELKLTIQLASPLVAALLAQTLMEFVNTLMLGRLGSAALAAGGLGTAIFVVLLILCTGLFSSTGVLIARSKGSNDHQEIIKVVNQSLYLACILSVPCMLILWNVPTFLLWVGEPAEIVAVTREFLHALLWGMPPLLAYFALREFVCAMSFTRIIMFLSLFNAPLTALGNYILMYGKLGFPVLGVAGIGYSTAIMEWCLLAAMLLFIFKNKLLRPYFRFHQIQPFIWQKLREMIKLSAPVSATMGLEVGLFSATTLLMGFFKTDALAAHQIALQCSTMAFMFPLGIAQATAIRVGQRIGEGSVAEAKYAGYAGLTLGVFIALLTATLFLAWPMTLINFFIDVNASDHQELVMMAVSFMAVMALFQLLDAVQVIMNGALRGLRDTFVPMWLAVISYWICGLLSGYCLAFILQLGGLGLWWGLGIGVGIAGILLSIRFYYRVLHEEKLQPVS